jgi:hypothetical protein
MSMLLVDHVAHYLVVTMFKHMTSINMTSINHHSNACIYCTVINQPHMYQNSRFQHSLNATHTTHHPIRYNLQ